MKILLSDLHKQPFKAEKFLTQKRNFIENIIQFFAGKEDKLPAVFERMREVIKRENIAIGLINGDFAEAWATERGMYTQRDYEVIKALFEETKVYLSLDVLKLNGGNHEFGYNLPLSTDKECGIRWASVKNFLRLVGKDDLYQSLMLGSYRAILVPYLFSEEKAYDFNLDFVKEKFLLQMKIDLKKSDQVMLFLHDPDSLDDEGLMELVCEYQEKIKFIFFGHYHSKANLIGAQIMIAIYNWPLLKPFKWFVNFAIFVLTKGDRNIVKKMGPYFQKRKNIPRLIKELGAILIPAPMGMFGIGGGFKVFDTEKAKVVSYK